MGFLGYILSPHFRQQVLDYHLNYTTLSSSGPPD